MGLHRAGNMPPDTVPPYRIEWRHDLTGGWVFLSTADGHDDALEAMRRGRKKHGGQARVIVQHVIEVDGG